MIDIKYLKGVGPKKAEILKSMGITSALDLLWHFPRRYEDRRFRTNLCDCIDGDTVNVLAKITKVDGHYVKANMHILKAYIKDGTEFATATWFNQPFLSKKLIVGEEFVFTGKVKRAFGKIDINVTDFLTADEASESTAILPVYPLSMGTNQKFFRTVISQILDLDDDSLIEEIYPASFISENDLISLKEAIYTLHRPENFEALEKAKKRLVFDEFFILQLALSTIKAIGQKHNGIVHNLNTGPGEPLRLRWAKSLGFSFTNAQKRVIAEIEEDMNKDVPMARLVQGDVGSGKTAVAADAIMLSVENGNQAAFMAPTEILAVQHYENLKAWFEPYGVKVVLLKGKQTKKEKTQILSDLESGIAKVAVGTHALFSESVKFRSLSLIVIDEQHRFGVNQRALLEEKGNNPDLLVMSATPIPRTLALTLYGDLDVSAIDELPPGRKEVKTICIMEKAREKLNALFIQEIKKGNQCFVVCPLIEESESLDIQNATSIYEYLTKKLSPYKVGLLHGKMAAAEKEAIMDSFAKKELDVLVSTTVIEVGVNIPDATVMAVEDSDRFGLAQLHQLRGRVGRSQKQAYCILVTKSTDSLSLQRLKLMTETTDGFKLAEADMLMRGPGEFFGTRQSGLPEFRVAKLPEDREILELARKLAIELLQSNKLKTKEYAALNKKVNEGIEKLHP